MIVSRADGVLRLVEQVEHGRVAGALAAAWGNEEFEAPSPQTSVCRAATHHDEGWRAWDARVLFNELERRPLHFLEIDVAEHVTLYRQGVERVSLSDVYAGVLVGMHWTGLYRGRWSAPRARGRLAHDEADRRLQDAVVDGEELRWIQAKRLAWAEHEPRSAFEARLWHNYELLQLWDLFSLYLSVMPQQPAPEDPASDDGLPALWGPQLAGLDHCPQDVVLPPVRASAFGPQRQPTLAVRRPGVVTVDPYPFTSPGVEVHVVSREMPDRPYTDAEVAAQVRSAPETVTTWRLEPAR